MANENNCKHLAKEVHDLMQRALDADTAGDKDAAIELYMKGADTFLRITDAALKDKLKKFAIEAISRAEELKGITAATATATTPTASTSPSAQQNVLSECFFFFHWLWQANGHDVYFVSCHRYKCSRQTTATAIDK